MMMNIWFTADTHFGHENIIKHCNRPFKSLEHMNETLIRNWNQRVKPEDTVIFLGDFCFRNTIGGKAGEGTPHRAKYYQEQLNGDIVFVKGNHDHNNSLNTKIKSLTMNFGGLNIHCTHDPRDIDKNYLLNLVGHVHEAWKHRHYGTGILQTDIINVGVDVWEFRPVHINDILNTLKESRK